MASGRVLLIFSLCCWGAVTPGAAARDIPREESTAATANNLASEIEISTLEWLIVSQIGRRYPERFGLMTPDSAYNPEEALQRERYKNWLNLIEAKNKRRLELQAAAAKSNDPWIQSLARAWKPTPITRRQPASQNAENEEPCSEQSDVYVRQHLKSRIQNRLRWVSLTMTFGAACTRREMERHFAIGPFARGERLPTNPMTKTGKVLLIGFDQDRGRAVQSELTALGYSATIQPISHFAALRDRSQELKNALREELNEPVLLLSFGYGGAVVLDLLEEFPGMVKEGKIIGWVAVDTELYPTAGETILYSARTPLPFWQSTRQVASEWNTVSNHQIQAGADFFRLINEINLPLESGFAAYTLISKNKIESLIAGVVNGANNFLVSPAEWQANLVTILQRHFQPLRPK